jgi:hypothetical protein
VEAPDGTPDRAQGGAQPPRVTRRYVGPTPPAPTPPDPPRSFRADPAWNKLLLIAGAIVLVVALLVVPGILNRGGDNPVADAAEATRNAPGVRMNFTMSAQGPVSMTMTGSGVMNGESKRARMDFTAAGTGPGGSGGFEMTEILDGLDLYMRSPQLAGALGTSKSWLLIRAEGFLGQLVGGDSSGLGAGMSASPAEQLDELESASDAVAVVGHEQVGGVATTHYTATIDMGKVLDEIHDHSSGLADLMEKSLQGAGSDPSVDVWIDDHGLLRRERSTIAMGVLGSISMQIDFSDYGIRPQIQVPPSTDAYDVTPMLQHILDGAGG